MLLAFSLLLGVIAPNADAAARVGALRSQASAPVASADDVAWYTRAVRAGEGAPLDGKLVRTTSLKTLVPVAHAEIFLMPACEYTAWFAGHALDAALAGSKIGIDVPVGRRVLRTAWSGDDGTFTFSAVPPGPYYLFSAVDIVYGKALAVDNAERGYDGNGRVVDVATPAIDFGSAHREVYSYLYAFSVVGDGASHAGAVHESRRVQDPRAAPSGGAEAGDALKIGSVYRYPLAETPSSSELAPYSGSGDGSVSGRLNLPLHGTTARLEYVGYKVFLLPAVQWAYAWSYTVGAFATNNGQQAQPWTRWTDTYLRVATTDAHGRFSFSHLPSGKYLVATYIDTVVSRYHTTSSVTSEMTYENTYHYDGQVGSFGEVFSEGWAPEQKWVDTYHSSTTQSDCNIDAALASVVSVPSSGSVNAPLQFVGWDYSGDCEHT